MRILNNESLKKYTTVKIGGIAENFYIPDNKDELILLLGRLGENYNVLSAGSNLLINDKKVFKNVIYLKNLDTRIVCLEEGTGKFYCGCSVRIQQLIKEINKKGYGGIEYLNSIPAFVGGMIYMNAGIGKDSDCISRYLTKVYALYNGEEMCIDKKECNFGLRSSVFQNNKYIILGAEFNFPKQEIEISQKRIQYRKEKCKKVLDTSGANFGSVFSVSSNRIMSILRKLNLRFPNKGMGFSGKVNNYLINYGNGTYKQAIILIYFCVFLHKLLFRKVNIEVKMWK